MGKTMKRHVVEVVWNDHSFHQGEYEHPEDLGIFKQRSVGFLVSETKKVIKLSQTITEDARHNEILVVDKRMLVRRRNLT